MHVSVLVYPLIIFQSSGLYQPNVMKWQKFQGNWVLTNFMKISDQIEEQKILMLSSWGKAASWPYILWGSRQFTELRPAVSNIITQKSLSPRSHFYEPPVHKKPDLIHSTLTQLFVQYFQRAPFTPQSKEYSQFSHFPATSEQPDPRCFQIWPIIWVRGSGSCDTCLWN